MNRTVIVTVLSHDRLPMGLASFFSLEKLGGYVVPVEPLVAAVFDDLSPAQAEQQAAKLSKVFIDSSILLLSRRDESIDAGNYRNGRRDEDVPAGLALSNMPETIEQLLVGVKDPADIEGAIDASDISKLQISNAMMTPARVRRAQNLLWWAVVALLALAAVIVGAITAARLDNAMLWAAAVLGVVVLAFAVFRITRLSVKPV